MDKITEELMKERLPVHPKCRGEGFTESEQKLIVAERCHRIEPIDVEGGGKSFTDPACRCTVYVKPANWWRPDWRCPLCEHFRPDLAFKDTKKGRVGQQKQKKKK